MMIFEELNNDCLLHVIQYLDLSSQLALMKVSARLADTVHYQWRHQTDFVLDCETLELENNEDGDKLVTAISSMAEVLTVVLSQKEQFWILQKFTFTELKSLDIRLDFTEGDQDELIEQLARMCPALTKLTLLGNITGQHLWNFVKLTELQLDGCDELNSNYFERIFGTLKLKKLSLLYYGYQMELSSEHLMTIANCLTLEELSIDDQYLVRGVIYGVLRLPHLRKLVCYTCDFHEYIIQSVANLRSMDIVSVIYNDMFWSSSLHFDSLIKMKNLRRLCLTSDDFGPDQLSSLRDYWPHLKEIHYTEHRQLIGKELFQLINLPHVDLLNLTGSKLWKDELQMIDWSNSLPIILNRRTKPLKIHLTETNPDVQKKIESVDHLMLNVSFEPLKIHDLPSRFMQIDLQPLTSSKT